MTSRNLFRKQTVFRSSRWWFILSVLSLCALVAMMLPKKRPFDEWAWQAPIEPPGVTIVSRETHGLIDQSKSSAPSINVSSEPIPNTTIELPNTLSAVPVVSDQDQIRRSIERWSVAWSARDMDAYFAQYAKSFEPAGGQSRTAWELTRRQRIQSKQHIMHEVRDLDIKVDGDKAIANFEQLYVADKTRLVSPKTLRLQRDGNNWLIVSEGSN
jgi:ketosteroid isomerase-like protein